MKLLKLANEWIQLDLEESIILLWLGLDIIALFELKIIVYYELIHFMLKNVSSA